MRHLANLKTSWAVKLVLRTGDLRNEVCILIYGLLPRKVTWCWKINILTRGYIFRCFIFLCHISLRWCMCSMFSGCQEHPLLPKAAWYSFYACVLLDTGLTCDMVKVNYIGRISLKWFWVLSLVGKISCMSLYNNWTKWWVAWWNSFPLPLGASSSWIWQAGFFLGQLPVGHPKWWFIYIVSKRIPPKNPLKFRFRNYS